MAIKTWTTSEVLTAADLNGNFALCLLKGTAATVTVTHTWSVTQTFSAGLTITTGGATISDGGASLTQTANADTLSVIPTHASFSNDAIAVTVTRAGSSAFNFLNCTANGVASFVVNGGGAITTCASAAFTNGIGLFGTATLGAKPTVTGSKGANAALSSLLTALASYGMITDSTS